MSTHFSFTNSFSISFAGPNAATQDDLYQMLNTNNRTWTVIDRGEPDSYFAIWDFISYIGQGGILRDQSMGRDGTDK